MNTTRLPVQLQVVALIFLLTGLVSLWSMVIVGIGGPVRLNLSLLGIPIYFGLRRLSPGWRTCALFSLWLAMIVCVMGVAVCLSTKTPVETFMFGVKFREFSRLETVLGLSAAFVFFSSQYRVLTSRVVRALFCRHDNSRSPTHPIGVISPRENT
ncbi:hypothetical protein DES53_10224 [Roseimicrobium gellanilyticum]|uniref:Uncharacterized protein n=1 Tax=Roseimicrobium gellanilyticum TaxID=748857 RepID=A0A366HPR7_9BACT|nr:hypothetical protein [Roseimicrobium gellanilyticum]RBP45642.1 hypothetical protein DES53_10224 [Roseimicrobium gellanilyticum]